MNSLRRFGSSIRLKPVPREEDHPSSSLDDPHMSTTDPLLSDSNGDDDTDQSNWSRTSLNKTQRRARRKTSAAGTEDRMKFRRRLGLRPIFLCGLASLLVLGFIQLLSLVASLIGLFIPDGIHRILGQWGEPGHIGAGLSSWPTDFTRDILPIPCHSHNDYWRTVPLFSAIEAGCIGVEADIWLFVEKLYVGHDIPSLTPNRTLNSLYIDPLLDILSRQNPKPLVMPDPDMNLNGVFDTTPSQSLILMIDFKTEGRALWPHMYEALEPLRNKGYLTYVNNSEIIQRPITVVGTGNTPFEMVTSDDTNPHHDVFFDAPLNKMSETEETNDKTARRSPSDQVPDPPPHTSPKTTYNRFNSFYASVGITGALGPLDNGEFTPHQLSLLRAQVKGAHDRGLKARYWELPFWPIGLRNHVWDVLVKEGVDLLNVDDLKGATKSNWDKHWGWWTPKRDVKVKVENGENEDE